MTARLAISTQRQIHAGQDLPMCRSAPFAQVTRQPPQRLLGVPLAHQ